MDKTLKIITAVFVGLAFLASAAVCSCVIQSAHIFGKKISCSDCASKAQPPAGHECCLIKTFPMDAAKNLVLATPLLTLLAGAVVSLLYITFPPHLAFRSIYLNGPPGSLSLVPLYTQFHSLRI